MDAERGDIDAPVAGGHLRQDDAASRRQREAALALSLLGVEHGWPLRFPTGQLLPAQIWEKQEQDLFALLRLKPESAARLRGFRDRYDAGREFERLGKSGVEMLALGEPDYPGCLTLMHDPPPALFIRRPHDAERLSALLSEPCVAIVGSRRPDRYGLDAAGRFARELAAAGAIVVSGMAAGIDSAAHRGALERGGRTIAVLGCGPDVVYPARNRRLYREILETGLVVSEYPPGAEPRTWRFPARNRIIAGLSRGVLVVQAAEGSGALITADFCLEQGKEIWALPGSVYSPLSTGPHGLLRNGAAPASQPRDILEDLGIDPGQTAAPASQTPIPSGLSTYERLILEALEERPAHPDDIAAKAGLDGKDTAAALVLLELRGLARQEPGHVYRR
ncbi:MAG: DNA-processing protein DprA [Pseudomonadota bacterium]